MKWICILMNQNSKAPKLNNISLGAFAVWWLVHLI